jgi:hypothetical protein
VLDDHGTTQSLDPKALVANSCCYLPLIEDAFSEVYIYVLPIVTPSSRK